MRSITQCDGSIYRLGELDYESRSAIIATPPIADVPEALKLK